MNRSYSFESEGRTKTWQTSCQRTVILQIYCYMEDPAEAGMNPTVLMTAMIT